MSVNQVRRHKEARALLNSMFTKSDNHSVVHYSCESFYDRKDGSSPRITSVAIRNLSNAQTISFLIHQVAEVDQVAFGMIESRYNELKRKMLDNLAKHLSSHSSQALVHWNMRDQSYGFAIEHRHRVLDGTPYVVPDDRKIDLSRLFISLYGVPYIGHPRLEQLLKRNSIEARDFLNGAQEAEAFDRKDYVNLRRSTLRKVDILSNLAQRAYDRKMKVNSPWHVQRGLSLEALVSTVNEHPVYTAGTIVLTCVGILGMFQLLWRSS